MVEKRQAYEASYYPAFYNNLKQKVHTKVIDAKLNQIYAETVNSTLEYIFQYTYPQDVSIKLRNIFI